jgi:WD40 repeat protein
VFISYAREDQEFVRTLSGELSARGFETWVDWAGIRPTADWMAEVRAAITSAPAFVFVVSRASAASEVCRTEAELAAEGGKRVLPIALEEIDPADLPVAVSTRHWIPAFDDGQVPGAVENLVEALETEPEWAATHTRLLVRATEWDSNERDFSFALRGRDLAEAEGWLAAGEGKDPAPTRLQREYVFGSRQAATRSQRLRMGVLALGLVVAIALAAYALVQRNDANERARRARSRELAASALTQRAVNPEFALLLAVEAAKAEPTEAAERALRETLVEAHGRQVFDQQRGDVDSVVLADGGQTTISGSADGTARSWETATGRLLQTFDPNLGIVKDVAVSPHGQFLVTVTMRGSIVLWNRTTGAELSVVRRRGPPLFSVAFSPDGRRLAVAGASGAEILTIRGRRLGWLPHLFALTYSVEFSPNGRLVATASADGTARIWDARSGDELHRFTINRLPGVAPGVEANSAEFSPDGSLLVVASDDGKARIWTVGGGDLREMMAASRDYLYTASFSPNGNTVVTGSIDGSARVFKTGGLSGKPGKTTVRTGRLIATLVSPAGGVLDARLGEDGLVVTGNTDNTARVWQLDPGEVTWRYQHALDVNDASFSSDGRILFTALADGSVHEWDARANTEIAESPPAPGAIRTIETSPIGNGFLTASFDRSARLWKSPGHSTGRVPGLSKKVFAAAYSPDGRRIVAAGADGGLVWDEHSPVATALHPYPGPLLDGAFSRDGRLVATAGADGQVRVWNARNGRPLHDLSGHADQVNAVAFSPTSDLLASASDDRTVRVWDPDSGAPIRVLRGHLGEVLSVAFSPDGSQIASAGADRTVRLWDTASGQLLDTLHGPTDLVNHVSYGPDGQHIVAASSDGYAYVLRCRVCLPLDQVLAIAQRRTQTALTPAERSQFLREAGITQ